MSTMQCPACGARLRSDLKNPIQFCSYCGIPLKSDYTEAELEVFRLEHAEKVRQQITKEHTEADHRENKQLAIIFAVIFTIILVIVLSVVIPRNNETNSLEKRVAKVQSLILEGDYDAALVEAQSIRVKKEGLFDDHYNHWENTRKDLIKLIEQKQKESAQ